MKMPKLIAALSIALFSLASTPTLSSVRAAVEKSATVAAE